MIVLIIPPRTARITHRTTATTILPVIRILITDTDRLIRVVSWLEALAPTTDITGITTTKYDELRAQRSRNFTPAALAVTLSPFRVARRIQKSVNTRESFSRGQNRGSDREREFKFNETDSMKGC